MAKVVLDKPGEAKEPARIGVYVCHCGGNISDYVDVAKVAETVAKEDGSVVVSKHLMFDCSDVAQQEMIDDIQKLKLNRLVTAACSPKLHEATFRAAAKRAGLNQYLTYHANIREQSSWPHSDDPHGATEKATSHVRSGIAYVKSAQPLDVLRSESTQSVMVVGGGVTGLRAALDLARMNVRVYLVEKAPYLGGHVAELASTYPLGEKGIAIVQRLVSEIQEQPNITVFTNAELVSFKGYVGKFSVTVRMNPRYVVDRSPRFAEAIEACPVQVPEEFDHGLTVRKAIYWPRGPTVPHLPLIDLGLCTRCGACERLLGKAVRFDQPPENLELQVGSVIVSTGFEDYTPALGEYGYGEIPDVVTLPEFERMLEFGDGSGLRHNGHAVGSIAYLYCVGSRQKPGEATTPGSPAHAYCSRFCCNATIHNALDVSGRYPDVRLYHFYRDIRTYGRNELLYEKAGRAGSIFVRYTEDHPPVVSQRDGTAHVTVQASILQNEAVDFPVDLVVLVTGMVSRENRSLNEMLSLPIGSDGFYREVHQKLRPVETNTAGLLIAGTAQAPKDIRETLYSGSAAAAKAATFALKKELELEPFVAFVDPARCSASGKCVAECPYGAIELREQGDFGKKAWVNSAVCKGCGACVAVCPTEAIQRAGFSNDQIRDMIRALGVAEEGA